ncbi:MAG: DUF401 family protein [Thermoplasmata archaeon]
MIRWIGFFLAITILLLGARKHLSLAMLAGSLILGVFTMSIGAVGREIFNTLTSPSTILLAFALTMIPIIGGVLKVSGQLEHLVQNLRIGKKAFLGSTPAILGLMPLPGGALLSSPLVERAGEGVSKHLKAAINVWFRHILYFVYPISYALIVSTDVANIPMYTAVMYLLPFFLLSIILGYYFLLRKVEGELEYKGDFSLEKLMVPLSVLIAAPILHFILVTSFGQEYNETATFIAISFAMVASILIIDSRVTYLKESVKQMKPWNFTLLIFSIYIFINIFKASGIDDMISNLSLPVLVLSVGGGFLLGVATGRIIIPASILFPVLMGTVGTESLPPYLFVITYVSIFIGYAITPVHPCIAVSLEYFDADMKDYLRELMGPTLISLGVAVMVYLVFF